MKLAILDHHLQVPDTEVFTVVRRLGLDGVELGVGLYRLEGHPLLQPDGPATLRQRAEAQGVAIASVSAGFLRQCAPGEEARQRSVEVVARLLEACAEAGVPMLHLPVDAVCERPREGCRLREWLGPLAERSAALGVVLAVELLRPVAEVCRRLEALPGAAVRVAYDVGNARAAGQDEVAELRLLGTRLGQVRLKDRERREPFAGVPLGEGAVNVRAVFAALGAIGYRGWGVLDAPAGDDPLTSAQKNATYARTLLAEAEANTPA
jgi:sugar phosphate isomerase/epimerase